MRRALRALAYFKKNGFFYNLNEQGNRRADESRAKMMMRIGASARTPGWASSRVLGFVFARSAEQLMWNITHANNGELA